MIAIDPAIDAESLRGALTALFALSASKIRSIRKSWNASLGAPVFTVNGLYTSRGWTEWTQGFMCWSSLLQFDDS